MTKPAAQSPAARGFYMPAEWEKQEAMWLAWPHNRNDWPGKFGPIPWVYTEIVRLLSGAAIVRLVVKNAAMKTQAQEHLTQAGVNMNRVEFFEIPTNRVWLRDSGPIFLKNKTGDSAMVDWRFNAWAKYPNWKLDQLVPQQINDAFAIERIEPMHKGRRVVMEGGALDVNGKGVLLTTEECLMSAEVQVRNKGFTKDDYEQVFADYLGINQVIWLGHGITGDDTHGHVDDLARFINESTIVTVIERDRKDENYAPLQDNLKRLKRARDAKGKPFDVAALPMPKSMVFDDTRLPASYANFLICNKLVLVPTFNDPADREALAILAELMPKHEVVGIHSTDLVWGFGTLHCMSQQQPA